MFPLKTHALCFDWQVLWNGQYPPRGNRGIQTKGCYSQSGRQDRRLQTPKPHHVCLGDQGPAARRESVRQRQRSQCQLHQQVTAVSLICACVFSINSKQQVPGEGRGQSNIIPLRFMPPTVCVCGGEKRMAKRPRSPYVWSGCSSVVQHDGTMTTLSPEHRGREKGGMVK